MAAIAAGTVRQDPESKRTAIKTALPGKGFAWFVFDVSNGGWYTDGKPEEVAEWPELKA